MTNQEKLDWTKKLIRNMKCTPLQARCIVESTDHFTEKYREEIEEKAFLLFMSLAGNVLSQTMDKEGLKDFYNEVFSLYSCVDKELLDWNEVIALNEEFADVTIQTKYIDCINHSADSIASYEGKNWTDQYVRRVLIETSLNNSKEYAESLKAAADEGQSELIKARAEGIITGINFATDNIRKEVLERDRKNSN